MPPLIWSAPSPSDVALPNSVAKIARLSIAAPGRAVDAVAEQRPERRADQVALPLRNTKYASARPTIA